VAFVRTKGMESSTASHPPPRPIPPRNSPVAMAPSPTVLTGELATANRSATGSAILRLVFPSCRIGQIAWLLLFLLTTFTAQPAHGQSRSAGLNPQLARKLRQPGDLTLRKTALADALFAINEVWNVNIVVSRDVEGEVSGVFQRAPLREVLDAILISNGYSYRPVGESLIIMKAEEAGELNPLFETATISVRSLDVADVVEAARQLLSPRGRVHAIASARSLLVADYPDRVAAVRAFIGQLDQQSADGAAGTPADQLSVAYFSPQYVPALKLLEPVKSVLSANGVVTAVDTERRVLVVDFPPNLKLASQVVRQLDIPRPQVRITAFIYDLSVEDMEQFGINWSHAAMGDRDADGNPTSMWAIDSVTAVPFDPVGVGGTMTFLNLSRNFDLNSVVNALSSATDSRLLARPNVMVTDNEKASIAIISEIPFQQLTETSQGGNIGTTAFREVGVKLDVTPTIAEDDTILMQVQPEFSRLVGFTPQDSQPIVDRRTARTSVRIGDGQTFVIGGLRQRTEVNNRSGFPYLKDIPWIGALFRARDDSTRESELIVFIRPEIVRSTAMMTRRQQAAADATVKYLDCIPFPEGPACECEPSDEPQPAGVLPLPPTEEVETRTPAQFKNLQARGMLTQETTHRVHRLPRPASARGAEQLASDSARRLASPTARPRSSEPRRVGWRPEPTVRRTPPVTVSGSPGFP